MRKNPHVVRGLRRAGFTRRMARRRRPCDGASARTRDARSAPSLAAGSPARLRCRARAGERRRRCASGRWAARARWCRSWCATSSAQHPGIRVDVQQIPWTAAHEKLLTAFVGEATPDVAQLGNTWIPEFAALDALAPLDARVARLVDRRSPATTSPASGTRTSSTATLYGDAVVRRHARALLSHATCSRAPATTRCRDAGTSGARRMRARSSARSGRDTLRDLPADQRVDAARDPRPAGRLAAARRRRDARRVLRAARSGARSTFYARPVPRRARAAASATTQIANLYQEFARGYVRDVHHRPVEPRRVPAPPARRAAGRVGDGAAARARRRRDRRVAGRRLEPRGLPRARSTRTAAWKLIEFLSRPEQQVRFYELTGDLPARRERVGRLGARAAIRSSRAFRDAARARRADAEGAGVGADRDRSCRSTPSAPSAARRRADAALAALDRDVDAHPREAALDARAARPRAADADERAPGAQRAPRRAPAWLFVAPALVAHRRLLLPPGARRPRC